VNASAPDTALHDRHGRPLRDLRISVIETCNFRCPYCMPAGGDYDKPTLDAARRLDFAQIEAVARSAVRLGARKLRLTGGEPLLRRNLPDLVARLAAIPGVDDLALTTNGSLLAGKARALRDAGLHRLTISLDALEPALFARLSGGRGRVEDVLAGIAAAEDAGFDALKFNVVVQQGVNETEVLPLVERFRGSGHVVRFIEFMDVGSCNGWRREAVVPSLALRDRIAARWPLRPVAPAYRGEVADRYAFADGQGEVGFVSSVSAPFCGDCHRARLSADGRLHTCLFASRGLDLRPLLGVAADGAIHADAIQADALDAALAGTWRARADRYSEQRGEAPARAPRRIEMFYIGG
jgi:cyclic pyranopterin phosphate synthase